MSSNILALAIIDEIIKCFADDMLLICDTIKEVETLLKEIFKWKDTHNLKVNFKKSMWMSNNSQLKGVNEIGGLLRCESYKYLGMEFRLSKASLIQGVKKQIGKNMGLVRHKTQYVKNLKLQDLIITYFVRSLMTYFVAPIVAAGIASIGDFQSIET